MKKKIPFATLTSAALLVSMLAAPIVPLAEEVELNQTSNYTLSIMHTNDTHAKVENAPKRITAIKEVRAQKPEYCLN